MRSVLGRDLRKGGSEMSVAFVFPGQGSQSVGMGKALADAFRRPRARCSTEIDAALGDKLTHGHVGRPGRHADADRERAAGPGGGLARGHAGAGGGGRASISRARRNSSPAIRSANMRRWRRPARSRLPMRRGWCASAAAPCSARCRSAPGAMAALIGVDFEQAAAIAAEAAQGQICQAANDNGGGQVVISGDKAAVERAVEIAKDKGVRRAMMLPVSGPFHSALMQPAAEVMARGAGRRSRSSRRACRWSPTCWPRPTSDPARDRARPGRAGDRHGALARVRSPSWRRPG